MSSHSPKQRARKLRSFKSKSISGAPRFRLLPITLGMLSLLLINKLNDVYIGSVEIRQTLQVGAAVAADPEPATDAESSNAEPEMTLGAGKKTVDEMKALKAKQNTGAVSAVERELLQSLSKRREELEERERAFALKEKILDATEDRINKRITEMKSLQQELEAVLRQYKSEQDAEIRSLVKIYENMKPVQAAIIFNELDMNILLSVVDKMSERKVAPVLAAMDPRKAKEVTERLAELRQLRSHIAKKAVDLTKER
jgi:flagellar motility protein MotE (MotC chaperone)